MKPECVVVEPSPAEKRNLAVLQAKELVLECQSELMRAEGEQRAAANRVEAQRKLFNKALSDLTDMALEQSSTEEKP